MKTLIAAVILTVMQASVPVPRQAPNNGATHGQDQKSQPNHQQPAAPPTLPTVRTDQPSPANDKGAATSAPDKNQPTTVVVRELPAVLIRSDETNKRDWIELAGFAISLGLLGVAAWGVCVARKNLKFLVKQTWAGVQTAKATNRNIKLWIKKEKARLRIELQPPDLTPDKSYYFIDCRVVLYGGSPAFEVKIERAGSDWPLESVEYPDLMEKILTADKSFPTTVSDANPVVQTPIYIFLDNEDRELKLEDVRNDRLFIVVRGIVTYTDVFDEPRETKFRKVWKFSEFSPKDSPSRPGQWIKCGPADQNTED